ncbi:MAG: hypothetical protein U0X91_19325 [Spirosomataceae bacterium]
MKKYTLLCLFISLGVSLRAQTGTVRFASEGGGRPPKYMASLSLAGAIPQGSFRDFNNHFGFGIRGNVTTAVRRSPIQIGLEAGLLTQQTAKREFKNGNATFQDRYKVKANSNVATLGFTVRFDPLATQRRLPVRPFADATVGANAFFSTVETAYYDKGEWNSNNSNTKPHWAYTYGGSIGLAVPVGKRLCLQVKGSYYLGDRAKYLTDPVIDALGTVSYTERRSATTMLVPQIGLSWQW